MTVENLQKMLASQDKNAHVVVATNAAIYALEKCGVGQHTGSIFLLATEQKQLHSLLDVGKGIVITVGGEATT